MSKYVGRDNQGKPRMQYVDHIRVMEDAKLLKETETKIWLSAYANNNPRSDYHWHVEACYDVWQERGKIDQYRVAFNKAKESCL